MNFCLFSLYFFKKSQTQNILFHLLIFKDKFDSFFNIVYKSTHTRQKMSNLTNSANTDLILRTFGPNLNLQPKDSLQKCLLAPKGASLFERYYPGEEYIKSVSKDQLWMENRTLLSTPTNYVRASDSNQNQFYGSNFASNNYLGLSKHPSTIEAGIEAAKTFGVNSAGSPLAFGATKYYMQLKEEISQFWNCGTLLYSAGWLAGFGVVKGLIKDYDHVVIDQLADNSFFEGARAATKSIHKFRHLDEAHMNEIVRGIRAKDSENGLLVITQGLFSCDSSSPNLVSYQKFTNDNKAYLLIGCHHDFGIFGQNGKGMWEEQGLTDRSNVLLVGTGSKTLSINFGFVGVAHPIVTDYLKYYSTAYMFTNAINPVQANSALATLRVVRSEEGKLLRQQVLKNSSYLRNALEAKGLKVLGRVSPFVCIRVGNEIVARIVSRILMDNEIHVNSVEYPAVSLGQAVVRISLMPEHSKDQIDKLITAVDFSIKKATEIVEKQSKNCKQRFPKL